MAEMTFKPGDEIEVDGQKVIIAGVPEGSELTMADVQEALQKSPVGFNASELGRSRLSGSWPSARTILAMKAMASLHEQAFPPKPPLPRPVVKAEPRTPLKGRRKELLKILRERSK